MRSNNKIIIKINHGSLESERDTKKSENRKMCAGMYRRRVYKPSFGDKEYECENR